MHRRMPPLRQSRRSASPKRRRGVREMLPPVELRQPLLTKPPLQVSLQGAELAQGISPGKPSLCRQGYIEWH